MRTYIHLVALVSLLTISNRQVLADEPADLKPLVRFYNIDSEQHYYTLSAAETEHWRTRADLQEQHAIGRVTHRPLPGTVPLHRATFDNGKYHSYFTGPEKSVPPNTIDKVNFQVYVWTDPGDGRIPVYFNTLKVGTDQYYSYILEHVRRYARESDSAKLNLRNSFGGSIAFWVYPPLPEQLAAPSAKQSTVHGGSETILQQNSSLRDALSQVAENPTSSVDKAVNANIVVFKEVLLDSTVTCFDMSEDGNWLAISHQLANLVTIYDVRQQKIALKLTVETPRSVLFQGDRLFVANYGQGTIGVYSVSANWQLVDELRVPKKNIVHLSIADRSNQLLVTCHGEGSSISNIQGHNFVVDVNSDKFTEISNRSLLIASNDGRYIVDVHSYNGSMGGALTGYLFDEFLRDERLAKQLFACQVDQESFSQEAFRNGVWFSQKNVMSGAPLQSLNKEPYRLAIPDFSQNVFYEVNEDTIRARRLNTALSEIEVRQVEFPETIDNFEEATNWFERTRSYHLDLPKAYTHSDRLHLFFVSAADGRLMTAVTPWMSPLKSPPPSDSPAKQNPTLNDSASAKTTPSDVSSDSSDSVMQTMAQIEAAFPKYLVAGTQLQHVFKLPSSGKVSLAANAPDIQLNSRGQLSWKIPNSPNTLAELKLKLEVGEELKFIRLSREIVHPDLLKELRGNLSNWADHQRIALDVPAAELTLTRDGKRLLLLHDKRLSVLSQDGVKIERTFELEKNYSFVDMRGEHLIAVSPREVDILTARNRQIVRSISLPKSIGEIDGVTDLAIHPTSLECFVCVRLRREHLRFELLRVDEAAGTVEPTGIPATWAKVSPDGQRLYVGYSDLFRKGIELSWNPGGLFAHDRYGNIDFLFKLRLGRGLDLEQFIADAGGNGKGIRLSGGGQRVVYLSHTGDPRQRNSLVGWVCNDFESAGAAYPTEGPPATHHLCFHPKLAIVAIPEKKSVALFGSDDGSRLESQPLIPLAGLAENEIRKMEFSPDGDHLVLLMGGSEGLFTRSLTIKWTEQDLRKTEGILKSLDTPSIAFEPIPPRQLDALQPPPRSNRSLTSKAIGRTYASAVVSIQTPKRLGSGFFVGKNGYILTNAHVIQGSTKIQVTCSLSGQEHTVDAEVIRTDAAADLALIKVDLPSEATVVVLSAETKSESGEQVTVIGSPGVGNQVLDQTMTTGIVSNPQREIDGLLFIQTDAPVNPGNSGGPMFDERGLVIGLVSQKGNLEGVGFAIPASILRQFLESTQRK
jgi:hypothetical protein